MDLKQVGSRTYYIDNPTNIGIFKIDDEKVYLIDSGNDKDAGRKIMKIIEANGFKVEGILATHSNADHVGGNKYIQDKTGCRIFSSNIEQCFLENPIFIVFSQNTIVHGSKTLYVIQNYMNNV